MVPAEAVEVVPHEGEVGLVMGEEEEALIVVLEVMAHLEEEDIVEDTEGVLEDLLLIDADRLLQRWMCILGRENADKSQMRRTSCIHDLTIFRLDRFGKRTSLFAAPILIR